MNLHYISKLPNQKSRIRTGNNNIKQIVLEFYNSNAQYAEIDFERFEYANSHSLYSGVKKAIETMQLPIETEMIRGSVYLRRIN